MLIPLRLSYGKCRGRLAFRSRQEGVVLLVALIILVALTIGGIALVRSVGTTTLIAGNLAFQQAATMSANAGSEVAIRSLEAGNPLAMNEVQLQSDNFARGYAASTPAAGNPANWDTYWSATIDPAPKTIPVTSANAGCGHGGGRACTLATDVAGNTVSYTIQRLCQTAGDPLLLTTGCFFAPLESAKGGGDSRGGGSLPLYQAQKYYYRITSRVVGPRNTVSYVQTIVAR